MKMSDETKLTTEPSLSAESACDSSRSHSWTRQDYLIALMVVLIKIGDGVEAYLPGVISQKASCELGISDFQEGILAVSMYAFWAIAVIISISISKLLGERFTLLLSLYLSIVFAILCAVVPNYYTLLLSRALTGFCAGLNGCTSGIFVAKLVSTKEVFTQSIFLSEALGFAAGGTWVSILGWLILDLVNWRIFILLTSIPLFVPPIIMIHFCIDGTPVEVTEEAHEPEIERNVAPTETDELVDTNSQSVPNFVPRVLKSSLFFFCNLCVGHGSIILLPWLLRKYKRGLLVLHISAGGKCEDVVQGNDFLILAAVTGAANMIGTRETTGVFSVESCKVPDTATYNHHNDGCVFWRYSGKSWPDSFSGSDRDSKVVLLNTGSGSFSTDIRLRLLRKVKIRAGKQRYDRLGYDWERGGNFSGCLPGSLHRSSNHLSDSVC